MALSMARIYLIVKVTHSHSLTFSDFVMVELFAAHRVQQPEPRGGFQKHRRFSCLGCHNYPWIHQLLLLQSQSRYRAVYKIYKKNRDYTMEGRGDSQNESHNLWTAPNQIDHMMPELKAM